MGVHEAVLKVMGKVGAIGENHTNDFQDYQFRGVDDFYQAFQKPLLDAGLFIMQEAEEPKIERYDVKKFDSKDREKIQVNFHSTVRIKYTIYNDQGESVVGYGIGEGVDTGDKATYKALSGAFKYFLIQTFCIPTGEKVDAEFDNRQPVAKKDGGKSEEFGF